jgi:hypothetical protein
VLFGMARFSDDVDFDGVGAWLIAAYFASTLASGCYGALLCWREDRFTPTRGVGGIPVETRFPT